MMLWGASDKFSRGTMLVLASALLVGAVATAAAAAPYAYIANSCGRMSSCTGGTVSVINLTTHKVIGTISVGKDPEGVGVSPAGGRVYVTNSGSNMVSVIDARTDQVTGTIPVGVKPVGVAVIPNGNEVYVANAKSNTVSVIDARTDQVTGTIQVGANPAGVAVAPDGNEVYVANAGSNAVSVIDARTDQVTGTIQVGVNPVGVAVAPDGNEVYVANAGSNTVSVIDSATGQVTSTIDVLSPVGLAVSQNGAWVYAVNFKDNSVSVIATAINRVARAIAVGYKPISFGEFVDARVPASTRESAGTLAAGGAPLSAAALSAPTLLAYRGFRVLRPLGFWCRTSTSFVVATKNTRAFNSSNQITLQKLLGGLRAILGIECPKVRQIRLVGVVHHARVYEGTAGASGGWILRAPAVVTRPKTGRPAEQPWLWIVLGLLFLGISSTIFVLFRKRKTAASSSGRTQYESAPAPRARPQATNRPSTRPAQISDPASVCPSCGSLLKTGAKFCPQCGASTASMPAREAVTACPSCQQENPPGARFCRKCGKALR